MGHPGIFTIRGVMGVCHLLVDAQGDAVLLDTGLVGEPALIRWRMRLMVPQHYDVLDGALHRRRFDRILAKHLRANTVAAK